MGIVTYIAQYIRKKGGFVDIEGPLMTQRYVWTSCRRFFFKEQYMSRLYSLSVEDLIVCEKMNERLS